MSKVRIRKVDANLKDIIRATIKNGNPLNFGIVDYGDYVKIISPRFRFYMNKESYQRTMKEVLTKEIDKYVKNTRNT